MKSGQNKANNQLAREVYVFDYIKYFKDELNGLVSSAGSDQQEMVLSKFHSLITRLVAFEAYEVGSGAAVTPKELSRRIGYWFVDPNSSEYCGYTADLRNRYCCSEAGRHAVRKIAALRVQVVGVMLNTDNWYAEQLPDTSKQARKKLRHKVVKIIESWKESVLAKLADSTKLAAYAIKPAAHEATGTESKGVNAHVGKGGGPAAAGYRSDLWEKEAPEQPAKSLGVSNGGSGVLAHSVSLSESE